MKLNAACGWFVSERHAIPCFMQFTSFFLVRSRSSFYLQLLAWASSELGIADVELSIVKRCHSTRISSLKQHILWPQIMKSKECCTRIKARVERRKKNRFTVDINSNCVRSSHGLQLGHTLNLKHYSWLLCFIVTPHCWGLKFVRSLHWTPPWVIFWIKVELDCKWWWEEVQHWETT